MCNHVDHTSSVYIDHVQCTAVIHMINIIIMIQAVSRPTRRPAAISYVYQLSSVSISVVCQNHRRINGMGLWALILWLFFTHVSVSMYWPGPGVGGSFILTRISVLFLVAELPWPGEWPGVPPCIGPLLDAAGAVPLSLLKFALEVIVNSENSVQ